MLSRIANSLYWIGRYLERAEDTARLSDIAFHFTLGMGTSEEATRRRQNHWQTVVSIAGNPQLFHDAYGEANEDTVVPYLTFDATNTNSIVSCVAQAREQARTLRHQIASEMWEAINRFHLELRRQRNWSSAILGAENANLFYREVKEFSHLFQGVTDSTMPRDEGWHFLQTGKFLERSTKSARALDLKYHLLLSEIGSDAGTIEADQVPGELHQWQALLRSFSAYEAYHKLYRSAVRPSSVVELIVLSPIFPRSIRFSIDQVEHALKCIAAQRFQDAGANPDGATVPLQAFISSDDAVRSVGRLSSRLTYGSIDEIFASGLSSYLLDVQRRCHQIGDHVHGQYFSPRIMNPEEIVA